MNPFDPVPPNEDVSLPGDEATTSAESEEFCYREIAFFPAEEFDDDPLWGRIHRTDSPHTVLGYRVDPRPVSKDLKDEDPREPPELPDLDLPVLDF